MARITDDDIARLNAEISVVRLIEAAKIEHEPRGSDYAARCPFHADTALSLAISNNRFHCTVCGAEGGTVEWVMKKNGISQRHAVELLRDGLSSVTDAAVKLSTVRSLPSPLSFDADDQTLLDQVTDFYHQTLKQSPEALGYLQGRGLGDPALIDTFKLGYANRTLGLRLPDKQRKNGAAVRARLEHLGVYRASGHEHLNGSVVFPMLNVERHTVQMYGRKIIDNLRAGTPKHLYLAGPYRGVWNLDGIAAGAGEIILTKSLIDAATFWCAGYRNVTAAYGLEGFTADHLAAFKQYAVRRVVIAFGRDEASERAAATVAAQLTAEGIDCYRMSLPVGKDVNAYAQELMPASQSLGVLIRKAEWLGSGIPLPEPTSADHVLPGTSDIAPPPTVPVTPRERAKPAKAVEAKSASSEPASMDAPISNGGGEIDKPSNMPMEALPAHVGGEPPASDPAAEQNEREVKIAFGDRRYRIRGLARNTSYEVMRVNVLVTNGTGVHVDTFDLYAAKARQLFARSAAAELESDESIIQRDLGRLLLKLEELQDPAIQAAMKPKMPNAAEIAKEDEEAALALLGDPQLIDRITADFARIGLVGEPTNALVGYLASVSRKLDTPLAIIVQSTSAAGKTALMDAVLKLVPEEDRAQYSAMTGQSLFYLGEKELKHKILAIAEEEGVRQAAYALKLLQSQGELTIASTGKDLETGQLVTQEYRVEGPVMLFLTTTAIDIDEELLNRCVVLSIDESREQTRAIQQRQRQTRTLEGLLANSEAKDLALLHRNAQRLLKPLAVVNPYADQLTFLDERTRTRRDHQKYLTLIDSIALLHQHQRQIKEVAQGERTIDYIEVAPSDIALANRLAHEVLGRSIDELPPQTRNVLRAVRAFVTDAMMEKGLPRPDIRFTRAALRARVGLSDTQLKLHLSRLVDLEYLLVHRAERGKGYVYELLYDGDDDPTPHLSGLIDAQGLIYHAEKSGKKTERSVSGRAAAGAQTGAGRTGDTDEISKPDNSLQRKNDSEAETAQPGGMDMARAPANKSQLVLS